MNEKERMIELTKYAYKTYNFVRKIATEPSFLKILTSLILNTSSI